MNILRGSSIVRQSLRNVSQPISERNKKEWYLVRLQSMAGTGNTKTWVRHMNGKDLVARDS